MGRPIDPKDPIEKLFKPIKPPQNILAQPDVTSPQGLPNVAKFQEQGRELRRTPTIGEPPSLGQQIGEKLLPMERREKILQSFKSTDPRIEPDPRTLDRLDMFKDVAGGFFSLDPMQAIEGPVKAAGTLGKIASAIPGKPKKIEAADELISAMKTGEKTVGAGLDPSLFRKLGSNLYQGNIAQVTTKETVQNAVDAVAARGSGNVTVDIDQAKNAFKISDDGVGMTPQTVENEFLDVGGSLKHATSAGGYGLAKVGYLLNAKRFYLNTVAETPEGLIRTVMEGSGDDWIKGNLIPHSELARPGSKTGTTLEIDLDTEQVSPDWGTARSWLERFNRVNKLEGINVNASMLNDYSGKREILKPPTNIATEPIETVDFPNATVRVYVNPETTKYGNVNANVLNQGLYQFSKEHYLREAGEVPRDIIFDVRSKVKPDKASYPFTTSREEVKGEIQDYIENFIKGIENKMAARRVTNVRDALLNPFRIQGSDFGVFATSPKITPETSQLVASRNYAKDANELINSISKDILADIARQYPEIKDFSYGGFGISGFSKDDGYLGVNIQAKRLMELAQKKGVDVGTIPEKNIILFNPYTIIAEAGEEAWEGLDINNRAEMVRHLTGFTWGTMVHEVTHQLATGHDTNFVGIWTRVLDRIAPRFEAHSKSLNEVWLEALKEGLINDYNKIREEGESATRIDDIFKGFGGHTESTGSSSRKGNIPERSKRGSIPRTP